MIFYGREPGRVLLVQIGYGAVTVWALLALLGEHGIAATGGLLGSILGSEWSSRRQFGSWAGRRAVAGAVLDRHDPGPAYRPRVDGAARRLVAQRVLSMAFLLIFFGGFGVACLVTAVVRDDWPLAWPATAILACTTFLVVAERRAVHRAEAWLADPPPVDEESRPYADR